MDTKALISIAVFVVSYFLIAIERSPRVYVALSGTVALILFRIYTPQEVAQYVDWETIGFLFGIFITVKIVEKSGFFNFFAMWVARRLDFNSVKIFILFPLLGGFLSSIIDSISVIIFLVPLTYALSKILDFDPVPYVVTEVCLANIGGASTLMGDPPNVVLGSMFNLGFTDFVKHNWILAVLGMFGAISVAYLMNRKRLLKLNQRIKKEGLKAKIPLKETIEDSYLMGMGLVGLLATIMLLILRDFIADVLPLNIALATLIPAFTMLFISGKNSKLENILKEIDIETILFLTGLFIIVGALEKTGVMRAFADSIRGFAKRPFAMCSVLFWGGAVSSGFIDNVPEAMSIGYLIKNLAPTLTYSVTLLIWAASLGLDIGGNLTPIGASANIVGYTFMDSKKQGIGWGRWLKLAFFPTITALLICWIGLFIKYKIGFY